MNLFKFYKAGEVNFIYLIALEFEELQKFIVFNEMKGNIMENIMHRALDSEEERKSC